MKYVTSALLAATLSFSAVPVLAQAAPITGVPSLETPRQIDPAAARLQAQLSQITTQVEVLTGKVESLEFKLKRATEEAVAANEANAELVKKTDELERMVNSLRSQLNGRSTYGSSYSGEPGSTTITRTIIGPDGVRRTIETPAPQPRPLNGPVPLNNPQSNIPTSTNDVGSLGTLPASRLPGTSGDLFATGKERLENFDYDGAEVAFRAFLEDFENDPQAGEAYYWLGEILFQQEAYGDSAAMLTTMLRNHGDDARGPDATVKLARSLRMVGDTTKACAFLGQLTTRYPNASKLVRDMAAVERDRSECS